MAGISVDVRKAGASSSLMLKMVGCWLVIGLAFHLIYHGIPHPLSLRSWGYVVFWFIPVLLGMLRWVFIPFATVAFVCFLAVLLIHRRKPQL